MALHTRKLLQKTEEAIQTFLKDDIEHTLPLIERLEEISYQLWKENNVEFLYDDALGLEEESEGWFWDEDVFYEHSSRLITETPYTPYQQKITYISDADSNYSSFAESSVQSVSTCGSAMTSSGYLGSCESSQSESEFHGEAVANRDDWIIISNELSCKEDLGWLLVSPRTKQEECSIFDDSADEPSDWTILSVTVNSRSWNMNDITCVKKTLTSQNNSNKVRTSSDSGIRKRLFHSPCSESNVSSTESDILDSTFIKDGLENSAKVTAETTNKGDSTERAYGVNSVIENTTKDWIIISVNKGVPKSSVGSGLPEKGQLTPGNLPKFAAVT